MSDRHDAALASLSPEQQEAIGRAHAEWQGDVERRQEAQTAALEAMIAANPCCVHHNRDGALRARRRGYEWRRSICQQHAQNLDFRYTVKRGMNWAEVEDAA